MKKRRHDFAAHTLWQFLLQEHRVALEVGVPGGRIDIVRLNEAGGWVELYEVKLRAPEAGISQLRRYGREVDGAPKLTLVVPPALATRELVVAAEAEGVGVWAFDFNWQPPLWGWPSSGQHINLPSLSAEAIARISAANREWAKTPAAAESQRNAQESKRMFKEKVAA